jgi:hypothetical protein
MSKVVAGITVSMDGYLTGPLNNRRHQWPS